MTKLLHAGLSQVWEQLRVLVEHPNTDRECLIAYKVPDTGHWARWMDPDAIAHHGDSLGALYEHGGSWWDEDGQEWEHPIDWVHSFDI